MSLFVIPGHIVSSIPLRSPVTFIITCLCLFVIPGHIVSSIPLRSPVTFTYNPHYGPVYSAEFSPFHRNAFISSAMDQTIRLYTMLQVIYEPLGLGFVIIYNIEPLSY